MILYSGFRDAPRLGDLGRCDQYGEGSRITFEASGNRRGRRPKYRAQAVL